jgi:acyl-CoA reductase-like NAD-dependent aldehyde dehydrogenase
VAMTVPLLRLDALSATGPYRGRTVEQVQDVTGRTVAELSLVPWLLAQRSIRMLRQAEPPAAPHRATQLAKAGDLFANGVVDGVSAQDYQRMVATVAGIPLRTVREAGERIADHTGKAYDSVALARPIGAVADWRDAATRHGCGVWTRRGEVLVVHAPANTPAVHTAWLDALALGYRVAVRPSRREPFTPHRLVAALRQAGYANDQVALLPTDHPTADKLIAEADVAIAFGADEVVRKYGSGTRVLPQGPGRSKILLTAGADLARHLDTMVTSIAGQAGTGCVNASAVFVEGDPAPVAEALAQRLGALPSLPPDDERAALPVTQLAAAQQIDEFLHAKAGNAKELLGNTIVDDLGDGSAVLRPAVFLLDRADAPQARIELGFPCVWVAPWTRADGIAPLRDTLALTAITDDSALITKLVEDPTISKVHIGAHPTTHTRPGLPHEGYLGDFLMHSKAVVLD